MHKSGRDSVETGYLCCDDRRCDARGRRLAIISVELKGLTICKALSSSEAQSSLVSMPFFSWGFPNPQCLIQCSLDPITTDSFNEDRFQTSTGRSVKV